MLRKILFTLEIAILTSSYAVAQNATIKGRVTEEDGKTPVEFATVRLMQDDQLVVGAITDEKGNYTLSPVPSGKYDVVVSFTGYTPYTLKDLEIRGNTTKILDDIPIGSSVKTLTEIEVRADKPAIIDVGTTQSEQRMSAEEMKTMAGKGLSDVLATFAGVTSTAGGTSYRGNRVGEEGYVVDGVEVSMLPPRAAMAEVALIQGAMPAEYANSTMIEIETKGFTSVHHGSVEARGNVQGYNNYTLEFYFTGPLAKRVMDTVGSKKTVFIGYSLSGTASYGGGGAIRGGSYRASQKTIDYLIEEPYRSIEGGEVAVSPNLEYVTKYKEGEILSLEEKKGMRVQNAWSTSGSVTGRLDFKLTKNLDLMLKGGVTYSIQKPWSSSNSLFNSINNGMQENLNWDLNARITHRIVTDPKSKIKNVFYRLYGYYFHGNGKAYSHVHKENIFDYGYVGKFEYEWANFYSPDTREWDGQMRNIEVMQTPAKISVDFTPSDINPAMARYTSSAIERVGGLDANRTREVGELYNGSLPGGAYGLFAAPGTPYNQYAKSVSDRVTAKAAISFDLGNHSIKFGFDFAQGVYHSHGMQPAGLWQIMRNVTNTHIAQLDLDNPIGVYDEFGRFLDTINYNRLVNTGAQSVFDRNIREKLGAAPDEWINIDKYEPSMYSLDMFSAEDLFNNGLLLDNATILSFYGYNYTGTKLINKPISMDDMRKWFNGEDGMRDFSEIGANKPIRISAYLQDKFAIRTLYFDLGLRLDIFNKNQPYVKDMFLYRDAYTVGEAITSGKISSEIQRDIPDFISSNPDDYYVYVVDPSASTVRITAYRSGKVWYNSSGNEVTDPATLLLETGATEMIPLLKTPPGSSDITPVSHTAFLDYTPTFENGGISLSPRIAFSFAVGEFSKFTASYNIITKDENQMINPVSYLYFTPYAARSGNSGDQMSNPGLKPSKDINYEIGFEQALNQDFKISFMAFYSEKRDQLQAYHFSQAYPTSYFSYTNMDFGTTQGFIFGLEMRKVKNLGIRANYTLQFAKGTGSSAASTLALIRSGAPNLRTLTVLSFDQRHKINVVLTYRFGHGVNYNGPVTKKEIKNTGKIREIKWLQMAGITLDFGAYSGLPYTASSEPYSTLINGQGSRVVQGSINGSRMPWKFSCNLNIQKGFPLILKDSDDARARKMGSLHISLAMRNILQLDDIDAVYSYTGSPTDDGFLTASKFQSYIIQRTSRASFVDYYTIRMEGWNNLGGPRLFDLSVTFEF